MQQPKLYQLLSTFSVKELRAFRLFLQSPYFNKSKVLLDLFDVIKKHHPLFSTTKLDKAKIYQKLERPAPFNEKFITDRFSDLNKLVEEFMAIHFVRKDPRLRHQAFRRSLNLRHLDKIFYKETKKAIDALERVPDYGWAYSLDLWTLKYELFIHPQTKKWNCKADEASEMVHHLDEAYIILKLRYGFHHKVRGTIFENIGESLFLEEITAYAKKSKHPVIRLYYLLMATFEVTDFEKRWWKAHDFYKKQFSVLPSGDQLAGLLGLINRGYKNALNNKPGFHATNLDLFKFGLTKKVLLPNGKLSEQAFKNIALLGAVTGQYDWTAKFIKTYQSFLRSDYNPNIVYLSHAYLAFYRKNFALCEKWLTKNESMDTRDKLNYRSLGLRCLFEQFCLDQNKRNLLLSQINQFEQFMRRSKTDLSDATIKAYQNFVYLIKHLVKIKHSSIMDRRVGKRKLKREFPKRQICVSSEWLTEKIEEL